MMIVYNKSNRLQNYGRAEVHTWDEAKAAAETALTKMVRACVEFNLLIPEVKRYHHHDIGYYTATGHNIAYASVRHLDGHVLTIRISWTKVEAIAYHKWQHEFVERMRAEASAKREAARQAKGIRL